MKVLKISFIIIGAKIGAGFASGKEIFEYFAKFGIKSLFFVPILFFLFYFFTYILLTLGNKFNIDNLKDANNLLAKNTVNLKNKFNIFDLFMMITFLILSAAMFSGLISLFETYFNFLSKWTLYCFVFVLTFIMIKISFKTISSISYFIVPIVIVCIIINMFYTFNFNTFTTSFNSLGCIPLFALTILYASQNTFLASFVIIKSGNGLTSSDRKKVSIIVAFVLCSLLVIGIICFLFNPSISYSNMPFAEISKNVDVLYSYIFGFIIFSSIITTYATTITSLKEYFKQYGFVGDIIMLAFISLCSLIDFSHIIEYLYPLIGVFGVIYIYMAFNKCNLSFKFFFKNSNNAIHCASKNTKNNC